MCSEEEGEQGTPHLVPVRKKSLRKKLYGKPLSCEKEAYIAPIIAVRRKMLSLLRDKEWLLYSEEGANQSTSHHFPPRQKLLG